MCQPFTTDPDTLFLQFIQDIPEEYEKMAYEFKAFTRARKIKSPLQLLRLVFLYCGLDQTLREVAATHTVLYDIELTDEAVKKRLRACRPWVKAMLARVLSVPVYSEIQAGRRLLLTDGSTLQGLASVGVDWRLHITVDLFQLDFVQLEITDAKAGEHLRRASAQKGDIVLADRGYFRFKQLLELSNQNVDMIVRMSPQLAILKGPALEDFDLITELKKHPHRKVRTFEVFVEGKGSKERVKGWVQARRIPKSMAEVQREKLRKRRRKSGKTPRKESLYLCGWLLIFTTLPPASWPAKLIFELYGCRWQVELSIKKLKSLSNLSELRHQEGSDLGELWLLGKLLYSVLLAKRMKKKLSKEWMEMSTERVGTFWRPLKMVMTWAIPMISGSIFWKEGAWFRALKALQERRRKRKLQTISPALFTSLSSSEPAQVSS